MGRSNKKNIIILSFRLSFKINPIKSLFFSPTQRNSLQFLSPYFFVPFSYYECFNFFDSSFTLSIFIPAAQYFRQGEVLVLDLIFDFKSKIHFSLPFTSCYIFLFKIFPYTQHETFISSFTYNSFTTCSYYYETHSKFNFLIPHNCCV